jgi:hypothetical protein
MAQDSGIHVTLHIRKLTLRRTLNTRHPSTCKSWTMSTLSLLPLLALPQCSRVQPHQRRKITGLRLRGWTCDPEPVDQDHATEDLFALVTFADCVSESSPTPRQTHARDEAEEDQDILKDPYFRHESDDGRDADDILETLLALEGITSGPEPYCNSPGIKNFVSNPPSPPRRTPSPVSTPTCSSQSGAITLTERLKATADGFQDSISQSERDAMVARILKMASQKHPGQSNVTTCSTRFVNSHAYRRPHSIGV